MQPFENIILEGFFISARLINNSKGKHLDSPEVALAKLQDEGFTHVAVQSLHTIGGAEYHDLRRTVGDFKSLGGFQRVILGYPLLSSQKDMQRAVNAILETVANTKGSD